MSTQVGTSDSRAPARRETVLVVTDNPVRSADIAQHLHRRGYPVSTSVYDGDRLDDTPNSPPSVVLFVFHDYMSAMPLIAAHLKERYSDPELILIGALAHKTSVDSELFDSVIFPPCHPSQVAGRVNSMLRLSRMQREISLRLETLRDDFGIDYTVNEPEFNEPFKVLFIGKASPEFMVIINALEAHKVETVAAFTSFAAFDFLHEVSFDAVVMNMQDGMEPALTITETMRRNSRLFHVPALFITAKDFADHDKAYVNGATDVIPFDASQDEIAGRVLELANYYRLHSRLKDEFSAMGGDRCSDEASGAYNRYFTVAHLKRISQSYADTGHSSTIMMIRARPEEIAIPNDRINAAFDQVGHIIARTVRMEDVVSRYSDDTYSVTFPGQASRTIMPVHDRLNEIINNTVFERSDQPRDHFTVELDFVVRELNPGDNCQQLIRDLIEDVAGVGDRGARQAS